jgi:RHS repeat-associated protein
LSQSFFLTTTKTKGGRLIRGIDESIYAITGQGSSGLTGTIRKFDENDITTAPQEWSLSDIESPDLGASGVVMTLAWPTHPIKYYLYLPQQSAIATRHINRKQYELTDHLGNVRVVISDAKHLDIRPTGYIDEPLITSYSNYYSFGMQMPSVNFSGSNYRYGFNGKEKDNEGLGGGQSTYDYGFRIYNPAISRFLSVDPLSSSYPWYTPYQFAGNMPIWAIDLDGLEETIVIYEFAQMDDGVMQVVDAREVIVDANAQYSVKYQMVFENKTYELNSYTTMKGRDPVDKNSVDQRQLGNFTGVTTLSNAQLGEIIAWTQAVIDESGYSIAPVARTASDETLPTRENGWYGLLDFKIAAYDLFGLDKNQLLEINGTVYDANEAGNFLWSMALEACGIVIDPCEAATDALEDRGMTRDDAEANACVKGGELGEKVEQGQNGDAQSKEISSEASKGAAKAKEKVISTKKKYNSKN